MFKKDKVGNLIAFSLIAAAILSVVLFVFFSPSHRIGIGKGAFGNFVVETLQQPASNFRYLFSEERAMQLPSSSAPDYHNPTEIKILDVGQGLSVLIEKNGHYALYDGGGRDFSSYLVSYMQKNGISHFDYVIASHYDEDHIGGLVGILNTSEVDCLICPDYEADTAIYRSFIKAAEAAGTKVVHPKLNDIYMLQGMMLEIVGPVSSQSASENDKSLVLGITDKYFTCLITGDAEKESETAMVKAGSPIRADVLIVGHHGSASSSCRKFIKKVTPVCAVISCGENNDYGHPAQSTIKTLKKYGAKVYRTDKQGEIDVISDGSTFWIPTEDYKLSAFLR